MRTTKSDEHHGENTQGREVLRCSDELRHPRWFRKHSISCLDLPQHSTDHCLIDNDRRGPRHRRVSGTDIRHSGSSVLLDIYKSDLSLSKSHLSSCQTLDPDLGRKTLLPTRSTPHANPANPRTNRTKTKTDKTQPIGKSISRMQTPGKGVRWARPKHYSQPSHHSNRESALGRQQSRHYRQGLPSHRRQFGNRQSHCLGSGKAERFSCDSFSRQGQGRGDAH